MNLSFKQMRTIGYSIAKSALKIKPKSDRLVRKFIDNYVRDSKTAKKAMREAKDEQAKTGFEAGIQEALKEYYTNEPTDIFDSNLQALRDRIERHNR